MDSEAKLFEYAAKEKYPNVTVNVVSNKKERNEKTRASLGKIGSDNNESRPRFGI